MSDSDSTISIEELVSRIVRLQDPETGYLFTDHPSSFDAMNLEFMHDDVERKIFLAQKNDAAAAEVGKLMKEKADLTTLIQFSDQLKVYLIGLATADWQSRSDSTLVFEHTIHPGDIYQHPNSRVVKYSAYEFAKEKYDIEIAEWDLPAPTRSADTASIGQQISSNQPTIPAARSAQTQVVRQVQSPESDTLLLTLSWFLDVYMHKKQPKWKELILDPTYKTSTQVLSAGNLNVEAVSQLVAAEIDMTGDIARAVKNYVKMAVNVILDQGAIQSPLSPRRVKGAYRTLYGLARLTLRTLLVDDQKFAKLESRPGAIASIIASNCLPQTN